MGLIANHMGNGLGTALQNVGTMMLNAREDEDKRAEAEEQKRLDRESRERMNREDNERVLTAAGLRGGSASGASGGMKDDDIDQQLAMQSAGDGNVGFMSADEIGKLKHGAKTGDFSAFKTEAGEYPPGFEEQRNAKLAWIAKNGESLKMGKDYDQVAKGRETQHNIDLENAAIGADMSAENIGIVKGAMKGDGQYAGTGDTVYNKFSGEAKSTPLGAAKVDDLKNKPGNTIDTVRLMTTAKEQAAREVGPASAYTGSAKRANGGKSYQQLMQETSQRIYDELLAKAKDDLAAKDTAKGGGAKNNNAVVSKKNYAPWK